MKIKNSYLVKNLNNDLQEVEKQIDIELEYLTKQYEEFLLIYEEVLNSYNNVNYDLIDNLSDFSGIYVI
jgi:hypothetical protein